MAYSGIAKALALTVPKYRSLPEVNSRYRLEVAEIKGYSADMTDAELVAWSPEVGVELDEGMTHAEMLAALGL